MSDVLTRLEHNLVDEAARQAIPRRRLRPLAIAAVLAALAGGTVAVAEGVLPGVREDRGHDSAGQRYRFFVERRPGGRYCFGVLLGNPSPRNRHGSACGPLDANGGPYGWTSLGPDLLVWGHAPNRIGYAVVSGAHGERATARTYTQAGIPGRLFAVRLPHEGYSRPCVSLRDRDGHEVERIDECRFSSGP